MALKIRVVGGSSGVSLAAAITAHDTAIATLVAAAAPQEVAPMGGACAATTGPLYAVTTSVQFQG